MASKLDDSFRFFQTALSLRDSRQQILASNIVNADTPNYKARDIDFSQSLQNAVSGRAASLAMTQPGHIAANSSTSGLQAKYRIPFQASLDGNTVEMDVERNKYMDNAVHFEADLTILGGKIKTMLAAIQG